MPSAVINNLCKLADANYPYNHQFFVDGSPPSAMSGTAKWRTILVGSLNKGGGSTTHLDVTDPENRKRCGSSRTQSRPELPAIP